MKRDFRKTATNWVGPIVFPLALGLAASLFACKREDTVQTYETPKEEVEHVHDSTPADAAMPAGPLEWDLPEGWRQVPNPSPMRFATLLTGSQTPLEIAISQLGGAAGGVEANVSRWRGQLGLPPGSREEIQQHVRPIEGRGARGLLIDILGPEPQNGDTPRPEMLAAIFTARDSVWFIKATGPQDLIDASKEGFSQLCASMRFAGAAPAAPAAPPAAPPPRISGRPNWRLPAGWTEEPQPRPMSIASIVVEQDGEQAVLTVTPLPGPSQPLANINRWRRQVGLDPLAGLDAEPPTAVDVAGSPGQLVDLAGAEQRILGVITSREGTTWFYKLMGPPALVGGQRAAFEEFVGSLSFDGDGSE